MKNQTIGTEIEFTGITREQAAAAVAGYFGTTATYTGGTYDAWTIKDSEGLVWKVLSDGSIKAQRKNARGAIVAADSTHRCELVTPILGWADIETLQGLVRSLRKAGAFTNETCGQHVHIGAADMTATAMRNLVNNFASHEDLLFKALAVHENRKSYCKPLDKGFLQRLNENKPETQTEFGRIWYGCPPEYFPTIHYDSSRYQTLNLHAWFTKGTVEFRIFNGSLHAGEVKTAIQLCAALVANAKAATRILLKPVSTENAKFAMRTWLTRPTGLNLNGDEFKTLRHHLTKNLEGNAAWRHAS